MAMDATRHDLAIVGNVEMTHRPAGGQDIMELRTQRLTADMAQTRHIRAVGMTKVQSLDIRRIDADGNVQIRVSKGDDLITADKMVYEGAPGHVTLTADENKRVIVARLSQPKPLRARAIRWNLKDDSFEIIDAGL
jgi:lipopolysaccharide export system protein LptA